MHISAVLLGGMLMSVSAQTNPPPNETQWAPCANDYGWCYIPSAPCGSNPGMPCAQPSVIRYGFGANEQSPGADISLSYHFVYAPSVKCEPQQFGTPTQDRRYRRDYPVTCDYQVRNNAKGSYSHPAYMQYEWCAQRGRDPYQLDCDTRDRILYARFGTPPDVSNRHPTGYVYRMVKGKFSCNEDFFGNSYVDMKEATCALSTLQPVQLTNHSVNVSTADCANDGFNCTVPQNDLGVTYTSMELDGANNFFLASSGSHVACQADSYVVRGKDLPKTGYCKLWEGLSNEFVHPVGQWVNVASCQNCKLSMALEWGVTSTTEHSITSTWSWSLTNTISVGFSFFGFSFSDSVSVQVAHSVANEMSSSLSKSVSSTCTASCGSDSQEWNMWQWQMDIGEVCKFGDVCPFTAYSCQFVCRSGSNGTNGPSCPLTQCADPQCNTCKKSGLDPVSTIVI